jgi:predicted outer membrane repeat protein
MPTFTVTSSTESGPGLTLRSAVSMAQNGDTIIFGLPVGTTINLTLGTITITKAISITSGYTYTNVASGPTPNIILGGNTGDIFIVPTSSTANNTQPLKITGLRFRPKNARGMNISMGKTTIIEGCYFEKCIPISGNGGGILANGVKLTISKTYFDTCEAVNGGGLYSVNGSTAVGSITDTNFTNNKTTANGGGSYTAYIDYNNCIFNKNVAVSGGGLVIPSGVNTLTKITMNENEISQTGGGVYAFTSTCTCNELIINEGEALTGGAFSALTSNITINTAKFTENKAKNNGGALYAVDSNVNVNKLTSATNTSGLDGGHIFVSNSDLTLVDSNISKGDGDNGGGLYAKNKTVSVTGTTFTNIVGKKSGGAVYTTDTEVKIDNCKITNNKSDIHGGGVALLGDTTQVKVSITNSTIDSNIGKNSGGGVYTFNTKATITDTQITNNETNNNNGGGIYMEKNAKSTIDKCVISTNKIDNSDGGGVYITSSSLLGFSNNTIQKNIAANGGGLYWNQSTIGGVLTSPLFIDNIFDSNSADKNHGGAIYVANTAPLYTGGNKFTNNNAKRDGGGVYGTVAIGELGIVKSTFVANTCTDNGGGIYFTNSGVLTAESCEFTGNKSNRGSVIYHENSSKTNITRCRMNNNVTGVNLDGSISIRTTSTATDVTINECVMELETGSAIYAIRTANNLKLIINRTSISNCASQSEGTVHIETTSASLISDIANSLINNNKSTLSTGVYYSGSGNVARLFNSTISGNISSNGSHALQNLIGSGNVTAYGLTIARNGSGLNTALFTVSGTSNLKFANTIIAANFSKDIALGPISLTSGNNLIGDGTGSSFINGVNGNIVGNIITPVNPGLNSLANNGGFTFTMSLTLGSPAINKGNNSYTTISTGGAYGAFDQRDTTPYNRIFDAIVDIGAYELQVVACYLADSMVLTKIGEEEPIEIPVSEVISGVHQVFDTQNEKFVPVRMNAVMEKNTTVYKIIKKDLLGENIPNKDLRITSGHRVIYMGVPTKVRRIPGAKRCRCAPVDIYTICTDEKIPILINGMGVMTYSIEEWYAYSSLKCIVYHDNKADN